MCGILLSKIIKIRPLFPQLIANNMSGCFFSETRCTYKAQSTKTWQQCDYSSV